MPRSAEFLYILRRTQLLPLSGLPMIVPPAHVAGTVGQENFFFLACDLAASSTSQSKQSLILTWSQLHLPV